MGWRAIATVLLAGLSASMTASAHPCPADVAPGDRALIVGIGNYQQAHLALKGPAWDRQAMRSLLIDDLHYVPEQVCVLADQQATAANVEAALEHWLIDGSLAGSRVFFYFSGHGDQVPGGGRDLFDEPTDQVLVAYDYVAQESGFVRDDDLGAVFDRLSDRHSTVVVDSCFSGSIYRGVVESSPGDDLIRSARLRAAGERGARTRSGSPERRLLAPHAMLDVWMAAGEGQSSFDAPAEAPEFGHFTRRWIELARSSEGQTVAQVLAELRGSSASYCAALQRKFGKCPAGLTPMLWADSMSYSRPLSERLRPVRATQRLVPEPIQIISAAQEALPQLGGRGILVDAALLDVDTADTRFEIGQEPVLRVSANASGHIYVFSESADGTLNPIYPAADRQPVMLDERAARELHGFRVDGPPGLSRVYVLVSQTPIRLRRGSLSRGAIMEAFPGSESDKPVQPAEPVEPDPCHDHPARCEPADAVNELMFTLLSPLLENSGSSPRNWGVKVLEFDAVEAY